MDPRQPDAVPASGRRPTGWAGEADQRPAGSGTASSGAAGEPPGPDGTRPAGPPHSHAGTHPAAESIGSAEATVAALAAGCPRFPDGRLDYSQAATVPVVTVFLRHQGEILILRRSGRVGSYRGLWAGVAGHLDRIEPLARKVLEELHEELGVAPDRITRLSAGEPFAVEDRGRTWLVFPVLADVAVRPELTLDREHTEHRWIRPEDLARYETVPQLDESLRRALAAG